MDYPIGSGWVTMAEGIQRQIQVDGERLMIVKVHLAAGAALPSHSHPHEQATYVLSGCLRFTLGDQTVDLTAGQSMGIPSNAVHRAVAVEETVVLDSFSPPREDFRPNPAHQ
jgi:quercetin dioxygenase-like cupin family protein